MIQIKTEEFTKKHGSSYLNQIIKNNEVKKWFFIIGLGVTYTATGTYYEASESVKNHFKNSNKTVFGIIKLSKIEDV